MNASGNRGDDIRALRLCEMQPYTFLHPNKETPIFCVLGLQSEQKAGPKGMKTVCVAEVTWSTWLIITFQTVNPTYTSFIAHRNPELCPLGAFAIYLHYIHDQALIDEKYNLDYKVNKSWRPVCDYCCMFTNDGLKMSGQVRLIHGSSAIVPYNETALQNLFVQSYKKAGVKSRLKAHLARHMLGYHQEKMG
jgi:hypothetical protein